MRIAKPILLTTTPLGVGLGLVESAAAWYTVTRIRQERRGRAGKLDA